MVSSSGLAGLLTMTARRRLLCVRGIEDEDWGEGNFFDDDPLFVNEGARDYHLSGSSPCIDTGDPGGTYTGQTDIDGEDRVMDDRVDVGADEVRE